MPAYSDRCQGIVYAEVPRYVDLYIKIHQSIDMVFHAQITRCGNVLYIGGPKVSLLRESIGLHLAGRIAEHILKPLVIHVCNSKPALCKQNPFAALIILKIFMLVGPNVVLAQIRENTDLELDPRCPVKHQPLG